MVKLVVVFVGCGGSMPIISYSGFGFRSDPRVNGYGGTHTTRITDRAGGAVGSNRGQDLFKTLQSLN